MTDDKSVSKQHWVQLFAVFRYILVHSGDSQSNWHSIFLLTMTSLTLTILPLYIVTHTWIKNAFLFLKNVPQFLHTILTQIFSFPSDQKGYVPIGVLISCNSLIAANLDSAIFTTRNRVWKGNVFSHVFLPFYSQGSPCDHLWTLSNLFTWNPQLKPPPMLGPPSTSPYIMNLFKLVHLGISTSALAPCPLWWYMNLLKLIYLGPPSYSPYHMGLFGLVHLGTPFTLPPKQTCSTMFTT